MPQRSKTIHVKEVLLKALSSCYGAINGKTVGQLAYEVYGVNNIITRNRIRRLLHELRNEGYQIWAVTPPGEKTPRICFLTVPEEYGSVILRLSELSNRIAKSAKDVYDALLRKRDEILELMVRESDENKRKVLRDDLARVEKVLVAAQRYIR